MKLKLFCIAFFLFAFTGSLMSQYSLQWPKENNNNTANFYVTCGVVQEGWTVNSVQTCYLYTPILTPKNNGNNGITYKFRINQSGNGTFNDTLSLEVNISNTGWYVENFILGDSVTSVNFEISGTLQVNLTSVDYIAFRLKAVARTSSFAWTLKKDNFQFNVDNVTTTNNYLPITLASFSGYSENNYAHIEWITFSEVNNDFFTIERSENNIQFYSVGNVNGAGNSNTSQNYRFDDPVELTSSVTYYRLCQTDYDGTTEVISPIAVKKSMKADHDIWYYIENSTVYINYSAENAEDVQLLVYDLCGKLVHSKAFSAGKGINTFSWNYSQNGMKGGGMYVFSLIDALSEKHSMKVVL
jgi:hypothetical protein